jgi:hypothetical protein
MQIFRKQVLLGRCQFELQRDNPNYRHSCHMIRAAFATAIVNLRVQQAFPSGGYVELTLPLERILSIASHVMSLVFLLIERRRQHQGGDFCFWKYGILGAVVLGNHHHQKHEHGRCRDEDAYEHN